jgi:hypothetical protein
MKHRFVSLFAIIVGSALIASQAGLAGEDNEHEGMVVKAGQGKLIMTLKGDTKAHTHDVDPKAKITLDGQTVKLEELKKGLHVHVRMNDKHVVTSLRAHSKDKN